MTAIYCPPGVNARDVVQGIERFFGRSNGFGAESSDVFFLDPALLSNLSASRVIDLLRATGKALQELGWSADLNAGIAIANRVFGIF
jgi:hypothetical protein